MTADAATGPLGELILARETVDRATEKRFDHAVGKRQIEDTARDAREGRDELVVTELHG